MPPREAACEPCRKSKLACDHVRPVCTRCQGANRAEACEYRISPFKRRRTDLGPSPRIVNSRNGSQTRESEPPATAAATPTIRPYPNPGFQGSLSSAAIFSHISPRHHEPGSAQPEPDTVPAGVSAPALLDNDDIACRQGTTLIKLLLDEYPLRTLKDLVSFWLAKGISLAHAESLLDSCVESMDEALNFGQPTDTCMEHLTRNSQIPLLFNRESTFNSYVAQFSGHNSRLETLGIFLSAVARATNDVPFFPPLYKTDEDKFRLRKLATRLSDHALEVCLSLDCLNDLQLAFQYENFIVHTFVDGDQSYSSWRRLGDVIASMLALGYHERVETRSRIPEFLVELRQSAFARIYTDDKEVSIFLEDSVTSGYQSHSTLLNCPLLALKATDKQTRSK
ncbi:hypothetical protein D6C80_00080 [Aureobasidium pullulans]|nr:hypothetical protein D6C80_00080 [Aureobasidium pullulans]